MEPIEIRSTDHLLGNAMAWVWLALFTSIFNISRIWSYCILSLAILWNLSWIDYMFFHYYHAGRYKPHLRILVGMQLVYLFIFYIVYKTS